jgi:hypothetical protein
VRKPTREPLKPFCVPSTSFHTLLPPSASPRLEVVDGQVDQAVGRDARLRLCRANGAASRGSQDGFMMRVCM